MLTAQLVEVLKNSSGKYAVKFDVLRDSESVAECESAAVFDSQLGALLAGKRAEQLVEITGKFPDMTKVW